MTERRSKIADVPPRKRAEAVFQSDLAMNLFMVLMVALATLTATSAAVTTIGFKVRMSSEQTDDRPLGLVASWQPVLPVSPRLVVRNGMVVRLDMDRLAESFAVGRAFLPVLNNSKQLEADPDPSAYKIELILLNDAIPKEVVAWEIAAGAFASESTDATLRQPFEQDVKRFEQFDVYVFPSHDQVAWDIVMRLNKANKRYRLQFIDRNERLQFERASTRFTFEDMYK